MTAIFRSRGGGETFKTEISRTKRRRGLNVYVPNVKKILLIFNRLVLFLFYTYFYNYNNNLYNAPDSYRFVSDIKFRAQHAKLYDSWRTKTANAYVKNTADANSRRNREMLRHKSVPDKLIYVSNYEQSMLEKINSARFVIVKRYAFSVENDLKFTSGECNTAERESDSTAMTTIADGELTTILNEVSRC